jgi:hypothetical protein
LNRHWKRTLTVEDHFSSKLALVMKSRAEQLIPSCAMKASADQLR